MPENVAVSGSSDASLDNIQDAIRDIKIENIDHEGGNPDLNHDGDDIVVQDNRGVPDCIYYLRHGFCGYGSNCRYNHPIYTGKEQPSQVDLPERVGQPDCQHFLRTGTCKYGYTCKYNHPKNRHHEAYMSFNIYGLPIRQEEKSCPHYMKTGYCKFGIACKFNHPQPASAETAFSVSSAYMPTESSLASPSGLPLIGGFTTWCPRPYISNPQTNGFSSYMPFAFPSAHGAIPTQHGWSTYMGTISAVSSSDTPISSSISNSSNISFGSSTAVLFPERPDQPDCQYYMKNGSCKYGSSCKYHHPRDRITSSTACTIGPFGLPLRPGQAVCTFYTAYGSCKYGLGCKFDHPLLGYYHYGAPPASVSDPSLLFPYQRSTPVAWTPPAAGTSKALKTTSGVTKYIESGNKVATVETSMSEAAPSQNTSQDTTSSNLQDPSDN